MITFDCQVRLLHERVSALSLSGFSKTMAEKITVNFVRLLTPSRALKGGDVIYLKGLFKMFYR